MEVRQAENANFDLQKRKSKKRRRKRRKHMVIRFFTGCVICMGLLMGCVFGYHYIEKGMKSGEPTQTNEDTVPYASCTEETDERNEPVEDSVEPEVPTISTPQNSEQSAIQKTTQKTTYSECSYEKEDIYERLKNIATISPDHAKIYEKRDTYPSALLHNLVLNDELVDFVLGYTGSESAPSGGLTQAEMNADHPLFLQWDERWGYTDYGNGLMAVAACGPTSLSMAVVALTGNTDATPYEVAKFSVEHGYRVNGNGTKWSLISEGSKSYGLGVEELPLSESRMKQAIDQEKMLILIMGPGHFTTGGHFIVLYDYDENGFYVNDPNSRLKSEKVWDYDIFSSEIRNIWALSN